MKAIWTEMKKRTTFVRTSALALSLGLVAGYFPTSSLLSIQARSANAGAAPALPPSAMPFYKDKTVRVIVPVSPGGSFDVWSRILARHMGKHLPGNPTFIVQNMSGGGGVVGANYLYGVAKPDGLTIGTISPNGYLNQIMEKLEVKYDWAKYSWIGATATTHELLYIRADTGYRTLEDVIKAATPPMCGSIGVGTTGSFIPRLLQELFGARFKIVEGYPGGVESDMAVARGEVNCRATSIMTYFGREPTKGWHEQGFTRVLIQTGEKRHPALPDTPTVWELAERKNLPNGDRRVMEVILAGGSFGVPFVAPPGISADHLKLLRQAFMKTLEDEEFRAEVARVHGMEIRPVSGHELEELARRIIDLPPNVAKHLQRFLSS